jgi:hypothetical protein
MAKLIGEHAVELENAGGNIIKPHTSAYNILVRHPSFNAMLMS